MQNTTQSLTQDYLTHPDSSYVNSIPILEPFQLYRPMFENTKEHFENPYQELTVYSSPPSSPIKESKNIKKEEEEDSIMNSTEFWNSREETNDKNEMIALNIQSLIPLNIPILSCTENGTLVSPMIIPKGYIAVDPFLYLQLVNQSNNYRNFYNDMLNGSMILQPMNQVVSEEKDKDGLNPKKRKNSSATNKKTPRRVRPKVVPEKGAIQCKGMNRKKNQRCRNAALMEYIGPRPKYCAEHIQLDPECLHMKCSSSYQKVPGDKKGCREVVLKEFGLCHKHYKDATDKWIAKAGYDTAIEKLERVNELLNKLENEAIKAKKTDADLYQRKNKLIPKFQDMKTIITQHIFKLKSEGVLGETR